MNPHRDEVAGLRTWPSIADVPDTVDLAVVAVRAAIVPQVLGDCAAAGVLNAVVFSSGFAEEGEAGRAVESEVTALAQSSGMRILGPNAEGFFNVHDRIPVSFSPAIDYKRGLIRLQPGNVAVVSQSGGLGFAIFNWAQSAGLGISHVISTGNEADLEVLELAAFLVEDANTQVVAMVVEGFRHPERLATVARRASELGKRLVVAKLGRSIAGARATLAHTAHDSGSDEWYQTEFDRWGILRAADQEDLLDISFALSGGRAMTGSRVGILTSSGGAGAWVADACDAVGLSVPELDATIQQDLRQMMPAYGSPRNPVDVTAQVFGSGGVAPALKALCESPEVDAVALVCSLASPHMLENEEMQIASILNSTDKPVLVYTYTRPGDASIDVLTRLGLAWYPSPQRVANALRALAHSSRPSLMTSDR